jgi:hypothetical protein
LIPFRADGGIDNRYALQGEMLTITAVNVPTYDTNELVLAKFL